MARKKPKFKLTTSTAAIIAIAVIVFVIFFATKGQTALLISPKLPTQVATAADLVVSDISWGYAPAAGGIQSLYIITVTIKNQGGTDVNHVFGVTLKDTTNNVQIPPLNVFLAGGQPVCPINSLKAGQTAICTFATGYDGGTVPFSVTAYADAPAKPVLAQLGRMQPTIGVIKEPNESNNIKTMTMGCALYPFNGVCGNGVCEKHNVQNNCDDLSETMFTNCAQDCSVCGDGIRSGFEDCDDSNTVSGDGCSSECISEPTAETPAQPEVGFENYPSPFVKDGNFTGVIVVGNDAPASDVIAATDIAAGFGLATSPAAKLDTDVSASDKKGHLILIGNESVNRLIAEVFDQVYPVDNTYSTNAASGNGQIILIADWQTSGQVVIIVSGPSPQDTRYASDILENYKTYVDNGKLFGTKCTVDSQKNLKCS